MHPYDSLREKLVQPFVLLGFVVSATLALSTFALLAQIEERAVLRTLHAELESFRYRRAQNPDAAPANASLLRGHFLPAENLASIKPLPPGEEQVEIRTLGDTDFSILVADVGGRPFALLYDRSYIKSNLEQVALLLLIATGTMTLLSFSVGYRLSRRVVRPIVRLLDDVSTKASQPAPADGRIGFSAQDYPQDEIGRLVRELDRFALRLYSFLQRESCFAADVSHELRTPVTVILGATEVLAELPGLPDGVRQRIAIIQRQASRMAQILEAMLLLGREDGPDHDPACSIAEVIEEAVADCLPSLAGRPVRIELDLQAHPILAAERSLAYVVVSNLVRNACAYTKEGLIRVSLFDDALEVADTGVGIPGERFPELMQRHAKGEGSTGHGLGLSIVARVCDRLGWRFSVDSAAGRGTRVTMRFAAAAAG